MPGRLGPRFALESGFLILLAALAAVAQLSWQMIVLFMAAAWMLVSISEYVRWKQGPRLPAPLRPTAARVVPARPPAEVDGPTRVIRTASEPDAVPPRNVRIVPRETEGAG